MPPFLKTKYVIMMPKHFICGSTRNIYFTKHDIYFTDKMFILPNTDLEYKLVIRNKYLFHQTLLYMKFIDEAALKRITNFIIAI